MKTLEFVKGYDFFYRGHQIGEEPDSSLRYDYWSDPKNNIESADKALELLNKGDYCISICLGVQAITINSVKHESFVYSDGSSMTLPNENINNESRLIRAHRRLIKGEPLDD